MFANRSRAFQASVQEKLQRTERNRLARECAKFDPKAEQDLAEEGMSEEIKNWPKY
jgi:hypothetical protein